MNIPNVQWYDPPEYNHWNECEDSDGKECICEEISERVLPDPDRQRDERWERDREIYNN